MNGARLSIQLDEPSHVYNPGESLSGTVHVDGVPSSELKAVELSVVWYTEGTGDEDLSVHHFERMEGESLDWVRTQQPRRFEVGLPNSPLSYDGMIVRVRWCVRVRTIFAKGRDVLENLVFRLGNVPAGRAVEVAREMPAEAEQ